MKRGNDLNQVAEKISNNMAKITITIPKEDFLKEEDKAYNKRKGKINIQGFRKGHATKEMIYKVYGQGVFYEDAADECINHSYYDAIKESGLKVLSRPEIEITEIGLDKDLVYVAKVAIEPDFKLGKYKGVSVEKTKVGIKDSDVDAKLKQDQEKNARIVTVDREIKDGDIAVIDFEGFVDGKAFNGGKGENYSLNIGSHSFIDNFEEQLIGHKAEDNVDVNVTFPNEYGEKSLAGKPALFKVKIHEVRTKEFPELNDEFASEISEFEKMEDYKNDVKKKLLEEAENQAKRVTETKIVDEIIKDTEIDLAPQAVEASIDDIINNISQNLAYRGIKLDDYLKMTGQDIKTLREGQRQAAISNLKTTLILQKIAAEEKIEADDKMVEEQIEKMAKSYAMAVDKFKESYITDAERENIKKDLCFPCVVKFLYENAKIKEVEKQDDNKKEKK